MTGSQAAQRKAVVDEWADGVLAERAEAERVRKERAEQAKAAAEQRKQKLEMAAADIEMYCEVIANMEAAIDAFEKLEQERAKIADRLLHVPGLASYLATSSWTRRLGDHLSRRFFGMYRVSKLGRIVLNAGGNYSATSLAGHERANLARALEHERENHER
jgi:hypothetical protein